MSKGLLGLLVFVALVPVSGASGTAAPAVAGKAVTVASPPRVASKSASGSGRRSSAGRTGVVLTSRGGRITAVNVDGSGVKELTRPPNDGANDHDAVASPDGLMIALARNYANVYVVNADGSGLRRAGPGIEPQWSPDGRWIAASTFTPDDFALARVYVMKPDGTRSVQIGRGDEPAWSPDGRWLAYEGDLRNEESGIYVAHLDGSAKRRLPKAGDYAWSPTSALLAYVDDAGIALLDAETGQQRRLVPTRLFGADAEPLNLSWSPDGRALALVAKPYGEGPVYIVPLDGSPPRRIGPPTEEAPVWSPDGTRIAYATSTCCATSGHRLTVIDVATGHRVTVPSLLDAGAAEPTWSADGNQVVFVRGNIPGAFAEDAGDLWAMAPDGTGLSRLTDAFPFSGVGDGPTWWAGQSAITPDPEIETDALPAVVKRRVRTPSAIVGVDAESVAVQRLPTIEHPAGAFAVSTAGGRGAWASVGPFADSVAFAGKRVYWAANDRKEMSLLTASRPGARAKELRYTSGYGGEPFFTVRSDKSLVAYTLGRSLWRIRGTHMRRIRRESKEITLLDIDGGRALLLHANRVLELVSAKGKLLRSFSSRAVHLQGGALSGRRVVGVGEDRILVFDSRTGALRASWHVGAPGLRPDAGFIYKSLLPYADGSALHVLDVDTGHDLVLRIPGVTEPVDGAITKRGLLYTWTQTYSRWEGRLGLVPLHELRAGLAMVKPVPQGK